MSSAVLVAVLMVIGFAPVTAARDLCVHRDGQLVWRQGNADCDSEEGNSAVAIGEGSFAEATDGEGNSVIAVGDNSFAETDPNEDQSADGNVDDNSVVAVGDQSYADVYDGSGNSVVTVGEGGYAGAYQGDDNTAITIAEDSDLFAYDSYSEIANSNGSTAIATGQDSQVDINDEDNCRRFEVRGVTYKLGDYD